MFMCFFTYFIVYVCLIVCLLESNPKPHTPPPMVAREVNPLGVVKHAQSSTLRRACQRQRYVVSVNIWLASYKLTGWLASLDLRQHLDPTHPLPPNLLFSTCLVWRSGGLIGHYGGGTNGDASCPPTEQY